MRLFILLLDVRKFLADDIITKFSINTAMPPNITTFHHFWNSIRQYESDHKSYTIIHFIFKHFEWSNY